MTSSPNAPASRVSPDELAAADAGPVGRERRDGGEHRDREPESEERGVRDVMPSSRPSDEDRQHGDAAQQDAGVVAQRVPEAMVRSVWSMSSNRPPTASA